VSVCCERRVAGLGANATFVAGPLANLRIGVGIALRRTARLTLYGVVGLSLVYLVIGTILVPSLWIEPLVPMLKTLPVIALQLAALAIIEDR
jgi:hypothetical protein